MRGTNAPAKDVKKLFVWERRYTRAPFPCGLKHKLMSSGREAHLQIS
jgi:hypothetical protein